MMDQYAVIFRNLYRQGYHIIERKSAFTLQEYEYIESRMLFDTSLERDVFKDGDWVITCIDICDERRNCFWHGQGVDENDSVPNPISWMVDWQNRKRT